ncbi:MAG: LPS export ABC transporter permease LptF [Deltaproteobacteria bacterium]|nr:MAG: LPS export ABC transporter permease LptF [Deltaproteobacteria bacterium]
MSIVNRYLLREILLPFVYALVVVVCILLLGQLFKIVNMVVSDGVKVWDVARMVLSMIPQMLTMALPISFFFAVLAGVGRLVGDGEVIALKAAGISPYQMSIPILQLAVACTLLTLLMSAWLAPWGIRQLRRATFDILKEKVTLALRPQMLNQTFPGMAIYLDKIDRKTGRVVSVFIEDRRHGDHQQTITALRGRIVSDMQTSTLSLKLMDGTIHEYDQKKESYRVTDFSQYHINFEISALMGEKLHVGFKSKARSNSELRQKIALKKSRGEDPSRSIKTLYERFTKPLACIAFALLGLALVLVPVRSGARSQGFVFGLGLLLSYHLLGMVSEYLVELNFSMAIFFMALPPLIFILLGTWLLTIKQRETELSFAFWQRITALVKKR